MSQFLLFASLGGVGTLAHYSVLLFCVEVLAVYPIAASLLGYAMGALTNFFLCHHLAFRSSPKRLETAPRFLAVALAGFFLNWIFMWSFVDKIGVQYIPAQVISTALILGFNYLANAIWTFGRQRRGH